MTAKRGNGEGTIYKRLSDDRWVAQLTLADGTRKTLYRKTRAEAAKALAAAQATVARGLPLMNERQTVAIYLDSWLTTIKPTIKERSWRRYSELLRRHVVPTLGKFALGRVTAHHLQRLYAQLLATGMSTSTINCAHSVLHHALQDAVRHDLVARNIAELVTPPRATKTEMRVLTPDETQVFLRAVAGDRLEALYMLALHTGMRLGEMLALKWDALDLDSTHSSLQVRYTLYHPIGHDGAYELTAPKTAKSRRRIDLSPTLVETLRRHKARQNVERLAVGAAWTSGDFVFTRLDGTPLRGAHVYQRYFRPLLKRAGLPVIRFHDLRHTAATFLLLGDVPVKVVSELLGHSSISITLDRYSHVLPTMQRDAATTMERLLSAR